MRKGLAPGDRPLLTVVGDLVEDVVVWATTRQVGTDNPAVVHRTRGGSGANVAALAADSVATRFIGCVGDDALGALLAAQLAQCGVDVRLQRSGRTGTVVVLVDDHGERTMFPDRGAAAELGPVDSSWLAGTSVLHLPAYGFGDEANAAVLREAVGVIRSSGGAVTLDTSAVSLIERLGPGAVHSLLEEVGPEVLFANADEAAALDLDRTPPGRGCVHVIKDGPNPVTIVDHHLRSESVPAQRVVDVRDTTGAGDAFAAGFLGAWATGASPVDAAAAGHGVAAVVLAVPGAGVR